MQMRLVLAQPEDGDALWSHIRRAPLKNIPFAGWLAGGSADGTVYLEKNTDETIEGLLLVRNGGTAVTTLKSETAQRSVAQIAAEDPGKVRALIGPEKAVAALAQAFCRFGFQSGESRAQITYGLCRAWLPKDDDPKLRLAQPTWADVEALIDASWAMTNEEGLLDPALIGRDRFREALTRRLPRNCDFIHRAHDKIVFKANVSSLSSLGGRVDGVYTLPEYRRQGLALRAVRWLTEWVLDRGTWAVLVVDCHNEAARRLYERVGYRAAFETRTTLLKV